MRSRGWVKLWRSAGSNPVLAHPVRFSLFMRCVMQAAHRPRTTVYRGRHIALDRGQLAASIRDLSAVTGASKKEIEGALKHLKLATMLETDTETGILRITVCNYERYQADGDSEGTERETQQGTVRGQRTRKKEGKEGFRDPPPPSEGTPLVVAADAAPTDAPPKRERKASRLPDGWQPRDEHLAFARSEGLTDAEALRECEKFADYWRAQPGAKGRKLDWWATYRNWIRRAGEDIARNRIRDGPEREGKHDRADRIYRERYGNGLVIDDDDGGEGEPGAYPNLLAAAPHGRA